MSDVITVSGLHKSFGHTVALDGLDLTVREGEVHGFLGPNGAGKSTTIRILLGLLRADGGIATVLGRDPWRDATELHRQLAYVPGDVVLWPTSSGGEVIDLLGRLRGGIDEERRRRLVERFELDETKKGKAYSKGNRQKVALVAALASGVPLLVLDEPTAGLDPLMEEVFQSELTALKDDGRTVLLSSHILSEVEKACDRVSIVRAGRIVDSGSLAELRHLTRTRVHAVLRDGASAEGLHGWPGTHDVRHRRRRRAPVGRCRAPRRPRRHPRQPRRRQPHLPAAHPRGALPRPLPDPAGCRGLASGAALDAGAAGMTTATAPTGHVASSISLGTRLAGFSHLLRLAWRRDRILIPSSVLGLVLLAVGLGAGHPRALPRPTRRPRPAWPACSPTRRSSRSTARSPSHTADALAVFKTVMMGAFLTAVLGFVVVRRHTRTEEDEGRLELLGAGVVGRWSALAAAVTLGTIAVVAASVLSGLGSPPSAWTPPAASRSRSRGWRPASPWSGVGAVVVQLASTTRGAAGLGFGFLGAMFALRAIADSADHGTFVHAPRLAVAAGLDRPGRGLRREPHLVLLALGVLALVVPVSPSPCVVLDRRDLGAGVIPARSGPRAPAACSSVRSRSSPGWLAARSSAGPSAWSLGGVVVGSLLGSVADMVADPGIQDLLEKLGGTTGTVENVYVATEVHFVAVAVAAAGDRPGAAPRRRPSGRGWARSCSRPRPAGPGWFAAHVVLPVVLTTVAPGAARRRGRAGRPDGQRRTPRPSGPPSAPPSRHSPRCG